MARAREAAAAADVVLLLSDLADLTNPGEGDVPADAGVTVLRVATKADLADAARRAAARAAGLVVTSAHDGTGLDELRAALLEAADGGRLREVADLGRVFNERHRHRLAAAREELAALREEVALRDAPAEVAAGLLAGDPRGAGRGDRPRVQRAPAGRGLRPLLRRQVDATEEEP
jgi:tRNA U34 5-carboxymethylaminomethyl modifying GTPase MnmE/TrmE